MDQPQLADDSKRVFHLHEKVYVYQGPLLYDAKIVRTFDPVLQKVEYFDEKKKETATTSPGKKFPTKMLTEICYMVHYQGWNVKWDEWVLPQRILEVNSVNTMLKDNLQFQVQEEERLKEEAILEAERQKQLQKEAERAEKLKKKSSSKAGKKSTDSLDDEALNPDGSRKRKMIKLMVNGASIESIINGNNMKTKKARGSKESVSSSENGTPEVSDSAKSTSINLTGLRQRKRFGEKYDNTPFSLGEINGTAMGMGMGPSSSVGYESQTGFTHREIKELIPDELKIILVDDWENITKNHKLVSLPSEPNIGVGKTLDDFKEFLVEEFAEEEMELKVLLEITESIKLYFEQCVGCFLLYRYERPQYNELIELETELRLYDLYSSIFLLRLLSIFPNILMLNNVDPGTIKISKAYLDIILHWLTLNKKKYFKSEYENQSPWISIMHG